jgi:plasmid stabilization system protein ParE
VALQLRFTARAAAQIERAERWWLANRLSAPLALRDDLKGAFTLLLRQPGAGAKVANARLPSVRRLHLGRVRYFVYYRVQGDDLLILTVWHASRRPVPAL